MLRIIPNNLQFKMFLLHNNMKLVCIGYNCGAVFVAKETGYYSGCSPTDWMITSPDTYAKLITQLFTENITDICNLFVAFDKKGNNKRYGVVGSHHIPESNEANFYYNHKNHTKEKILRRLQRLKNNLNDIGTPLVFLYVEDYKEKEAPRFDNEIITSLIKLVNVISLFRPKNTFRICYIGTEEMPCPEILSGMGIDYIQVHHCPEERFWIIPCVETFKSYYSSKYAGASSV